MSWAAAAAAAARRGARVWRNVETGGAKAGCTGIQGGTGWGKGGKRPKREKDPTQFVGHTTWANAKCSPAAAQSVKQAIILRLDTKVNVVFCTQS